MPQPVRANDVRTGDCLDILPTLPPASFDSVVTDPPYPYIDRDYGRWNEREWRDLMDEVVRQCRRVLKPSGSAVFILQPNSEKIGRMRTWLWKFLSHWGDEWGIVQDVYWWNNTAITDAFSIQGRLTRPSVKYCVWMGSEDCYRNQGRVMKSSNETGKRHPVPRQVRPSGHGVTDHKMREKAAASGQSRPFNLLPFPNNGGADSGSSWGHPACTPLELMKWWVRYLTPPGGKVLDPFGGSGTTGVATKAYGMRSLLIERNPDYAYLAAARIRLTDGPMIPAVFL